MRRLAVRRALQAIPVLLVIYTATFFLIRATPGSPFASRAARPLPPAVEAKIEAQYGLDDPWYVQYARYLGAAAHGDFGPSYSKQGLEVREIVASSLPITLEIVVGAFVLGALIGVPAGLLAAVRRDGWIDHLIGVTCGAALTLPVFAITSILIVLLGVYLGWVPTQGWDGLFSATAVVPVLALAIEPVALYARFTRASAIEVLQSDYIRTARARGLRRRAVVFRHTLKNALIPVVTVGGLEFATLLSSVLAVERICNVPGFGRILVGALVSRDYPLIMAGTLIFTVLIVTANLLVDVAVMRLDPRVMISA